MPDKYPPAQFKQVYNHYQPAGQVVAGFNYCPSCGAKLALIEKDQVQRPTCSNCGYIQYRNPAPAVSILITDKNRVLLGKRAGEPGKGTWALPSGYIEFDDDFLTTAIHEAKEETGLDVTPHSITNVISSFVSPRFHYLVIYVAVRVVGGELAAGDDLAAVEWFPLSGPLPKLGFVEDLEAIQWYAQEHHKGLPVDYRFRAK